MSFGTIDQENLLAVLAFDDSPGGCLVAAQVLPADAWDTHYGRLYTKLAEFVSRFKTSPGDHAMEIVEQLCKVEPDSAELYREIFSSMVQTWENRVNRDYVYSRAALFGRHSRLRQGIGEALTHLKAITEESVSKAELALDAARRQNVASFDVGISTHDPEAVARAATERPDEPFLTGIPELDEEGLGPARKELFMLAGAYGTGKSFGLQELGLAGSLLNRAKVLHISLEMVGAKVCRRYVQRIFGYGTKAQKVPYTRFLREQDRLIDLEFDTLELCGLYDEGAYDDIVRRAANLKRRSQVVIKGFPSGELTIAQLEAYLDYLYGHTGFQPDILVLDYMQIMKIVSAAHKRQELGKIAVELRGLADRRNCAVVTALQLNREGMKSAMARGSSISEDISAAHTADRLIIYNQTEAEKALGIARLWVDKGRDARDGFEILITQAYAGAQYRLDSMRMHSSYEDVIERIEQMGDAA